MVVPYNNEPSKRPNTALERAFDASSLRAIEIPGSPRRGSSTWGKFSSCEDLVNGDSLWPNGEPYGRNNVLGRTNYSTEVLPRDSLYLITRQDIQLLTEQHNVEPILEARFRPLPINETSEMVCELLKTRFSNVANPAIVSQKLRGLSAMRCVNYLNYSFDAGFEEVELNGVKTTPAAMVADLPGLQCVPACEVAPLSFWGGPPGKRGWYDGSLLTLLVDRIMQAAESGNQALLSRFMNLTI